MSARIGNVDVTSLGMNCDSKRQHELTSLRSRPSPRKKEFPIRIESLNSIVVMINHIDAVTLRRKRYIDGRSKLTITNPVAPPATNLIEVFVENYQFCTGWIN
ncbi:hypothetical protein D9M72_651930 [compost metagenome]